MTEQEIYQYIEMTPFRGRKPVFKSTKITVEHIVDDLANGMSVEEILAEHKDLTPKHIQAAFVFCRTAIKEADTLRLAYSINSLPG